MSLPDFDGAPARIDETIERALAEQRVVGTVVLVARNGDMVHSRAAGFADRESATPIRVDAIFRLASITKPIVTAAAMRLREKGRLDLNAPVTRWLPDFRPSLPDGSRPEITIHHLLAHSSGLGYRFFEPAGGPYDRLSVSDGLDQPGLSLADNLSRLASAPLAFPPGQGWRYSLGLDVLGAVLEKIEGRPLSEIVRDLVTGPLHITDTDFTVRDRSRLTQAYADGNPTPVLMTDGMAVPLNGTAAIFAPSRCLNSASYPSGGAGMVGTADDILNFLETIRAGGAPILSRETVETMTTGQVGQQAETLGPGWGFGYGWAVLGDPALTSTPQAPGTLQWIGAYGHTWFIDRARGLSVIALTNTAFEGMTGAFPTEIRNAIYGFKAQ